MKQPVAEQRGKRVVLDEIHRLEHPSELLKIAADHFPRTRVLATGSSTLGASAGFRDTLAGRKEEIWLTPMILADELPERDFQEWVDAYWAKDVLELFRLERRQSFQRLPSSSTSTAQSCGRKGWPRSGVERP